LAAGSNYLHGREKNKRSPKSGSGVDSQISKLQRKCSRESSPGIDPLFESKH
jgi:hypothetical protein